MTPLSRKPLQGAPPPSAATPPPFPGDAQRRRGVGMPRRDLGGAGPAIGMAQRKTCGVAVEQCGTNGGSP
jgi:hypothetical protein